MSLPVLATKLRPPRYMDQAAGSSAPLDMLARPSLLQRLNSTPLAQAIIIYGPEGSGKTSLISAWMHQIAQDSPACAAAWLTLDEGDNDPTRYLAGVAMALSSVQPGLGAALRATLEAPHPPRMAELLTGLLREIAAIQARVILVLDDYETLHTSRIHQATSFLANNLPPNASLLISSSSAALPQWEGFYLQAGWTIIAPDELRFTASETSALLSKFFQVKLSSEQADILTERTRGLAVGIQMAGLALQRNLRASLFWQELVEMDMPVLSFLTDKVLERQMDAVRDFLVFTSLFTRLNGDLCDEILRASPAGLQAPGRGRVTLEHLAKTRLLTTCSDAHGEWFRYHPCFARQLQERLAKLYPGLFTHLRRKASLWLESRGDLEEAFHLALAYGDEDRAAQIIESHVLSMVGAGQISTVLTWLGHLNAGLVLQHPWLCLAEAWATAYEGWKLGVDTLLSTVELAIFDMPPNLAQRARGHVAAIRIQIMRDEGDIVRREELARRALELLPPEDRAIRCFIATQLGLELRQRGRLETASEAFTEAIACTMQSTNRSAAVMAYCRLADLHLVEGRLQKVLVLSEEALGVAQTHQVESGYALLPAGLAHLYAGLVLYERDELDVSQGYVENGIALCTAWGALDAASLGQALLASILNARGSLEKARQAAAHTELVLEKARQDYARQVAQMPADPRERNVLFLATQLNRAEARLAGLRLGWNEAEAAGIWLEKSGYAADDLFEFPQAYVYVNVGKVLLAQGRMLEARRLARRLAMVCESAGANYTLVHALVLQAQIMQLNNDYNGALASLKRALLLAESEKLIRPFFDGLYDIKRLLKRLSEAGPGSIFARTLLAALERQAYRSDGSSDYSSLSIRPQTRPLLTQNQAGELSFTDREKEILYLLGSYLSVLEIASRLEISDRTADTIVHNICRKLGVREPSQAVVVARTMKLI